MKDCNNSNLMVITLSMNDHDHVWKRLTFFKSIFIFQYITTSNFQGVIFSNKNIFNKLYKKPLSNLNNLKKERVSQAIFIKTLYSILQKYKLIRINHKSLLKISCNFLSFFPSHYYRLKYGYQSLSIINSIPYK